MGSFALRTSTDAANAVYSFFSLSINSSDLWISWCSLVADCSYSIPKESMVIFMIQSEILVFISKLQSIQSSSDRGRGSPP